MIGKTRQQPAEIEESFDPALGKPRGVLQRTPPTAGKFRHARRSVSPDLMPWIDHYWMVSWDLRGLEPRIVESLPHPNVHLVFERDNSKIWGISTSKFSRTLEGKSHVFGVKFTPGGFFPFLGCSVSSITNRSVAVHEVFGSEIVELEDFIVSNENEDEMMDATNGFFLARLPAPDEKTGLARQLVERILRERDILTVDDLADRAGIGLRSLQRLFSQYVGASPKWVIRRYRLHELLERMHSGEQLDWAQLAAELGYFDQAHLINDFKSIVGSAPTEYPGLQRPRDIAE